VTYASSADDVTWKLAAQYDFADDVMGYLTVSTGLKPGGINSIFAPLEPTLVQAVFEGEHATSYEVGIKSRFADDRVQLNAAAFLYDYEDYQFHTENFRAFTGGVSNAPEVQIYGAEFEFTAFITGSLRFDANVSLLDGKVDSDLLALDPIRARAADAETIAQGSFVGSPLNVELRTAEVGNLNGNTPAKLPPLQVFARLTHSLAIGGYGELTTSLAYTYKDEYDYTVFNTAGFETPSFDAWDLNLHYEPYEGNWYAALAVTNLEDDDNINARWAPVFGQGFTSDQFFPPRQVQARVGFRF
jgi:iron complex outermembrane receptor protein